MVKLGSLLARIAIGLLAFCLICLLLRSPTLWVPGAFIAISFAIVGKGNRLAWLWRFPFVVATVMVAPFALLSYADKASGGSLAISLIGFVCVTILPGLVLVMAYRFGRRRDVEAETLSGVARDIQG